MIQYNRTNSLRKDNDMNNLLPADRTIPADLSPLFHNYQELLEMQQLYNAAIKEIKTKLDILNDEFKVRYMRNPIHHIDSRLKSPSSIVGKLAKRAFGPDSRVAPFCPAKLRFPGLLFLIPQDKYADLFT